MFSVGNRVKCVCGIEETLEFGAVYTVKSVNGHFLNLNEVSGAWYSERFVVLKDRKPAATARANDPATSKGNRKVNKYEQAVLNALDLGGGNKATLTGKEIAQLTGHPLNCITPRFAPLRRKGLIKALPAPAPMYGDMRRDRQIVWVLA